MAWISRLIAWLKTMAQPGSVRFQNNEFINNRFGGFLIGGHDVEIVNNKMHGGVSKKIVIAGRCTVLAMRFYVGGGNNLFDGNELYDVPSWVFHIYNYYDSGNAHGNLVQNNIIHDFGYGDDRANGILASSGAGNQIYDNVVYNGSNGIAVWRGCNGCVVMNNTISNMNRWPRSGGFQ